MNRILVIFFVVFCWSCGDARREPLIENETDLERRSLSWVEGFEFYENQNEEGVILYDLVNSGVVLSRWAHLKPGGEKIPEVHYLEKDIQLAAQSTTQMAMLECLEGLDQLSCVAYLDYVKSSEIKQRAQDGRLDDISGVGEIDFEKLVQCNPDLMLIYPFGYESEEKFSKAGIASIPISEYLEPHPLGRSEWIKLIGWLINKEEKADEVFSQIESKYLSIAKAKNVNGPVVFTGSYSGGNWYAPGGDTFMAQFIEDAGGLYLFEEEHVNENITLPFEELYTKALNADFWSKVVYEKGDLTMDQIRLEDERFSNLKCFQSSNVFYCNAAESDYFGAGVMEPHLILTDLIHLLNKEPFESNFFKPVKE